MQLVIIDSALKHGLTKEEIQYAADNVLRCRTVLRDKGEKRVEFSLGILPNGNICEMISQFSDDDTKLVIFHAMTPPKLGFLSTLEKGENNE